MSGSPASERGDYITDDPIRYWTPKLPCRLDPECGFDERGYPFWRMMTPARMTRRGFPRDLMSVRGSPANGPAAEAVDQSAVDKHQRIGAFLAGPNFAGRQNRQTEEGEDEEGLFCRVHFFE